MADPMIKFTPDGQGGHHSGIPARDLSAADYDALTTEQRATVRASKLYGYAAYAEATKAAKDSKPEPAKDAGKSNG